MRFGVYFFAIFLTTVAARPQGTVVFNNRNTAIFLDAPVTMYTQTGPGPGTAYSAGLYYNGALVPGSVTTFRAEPSDPTPALAKYIVPLTVAIPGTQPDQKNVPVQMRVWLTAAGSYENALLSERGLSEDLVIAQLGGGPNPDVNNNLPPSFLGVVVGFNSPEPATLTIFGGGALAFAAFARRRGTRGASLRCVEHG